jgi:hypothetical protein
VIYGEFSDHRSLSAIVADMLISFVPGVVIVTSARDAIAIILRLATHPEKREDLMEWVLLCACLIVIALPVAMAAGGAAAAGVGAVVGGIAGTELGAALRAVMLMLIKEASQLVELIRFLQKFIKGDILKFLRLVKLTKYEKPLLLAVKKFTGKLIEMVRSLRLHLESLRYFDSVKSTIIKLAAAGCTQADTKGPGRAGGKANESSGANCTERDAYGACRGCGRQNRRGLAS